VGGKQTARGCAGCMMTGVVVDGYLCHTHETRPAEMGLRYESNRG